ncbi:hemerythrin family protein [Methylocystis bryophila]
MDQIAFIERVAAEPRFDAHRMVVALWELLEVTNQHFAHEEKAMVDDAFPRLALHRRDHEYLLKALRDYIAAFVDNTERPSASFCDNLRSWIGFHCRRYDEDYSRFSDWRRASGSRA